MRLARDKQHAQLVAHAIDRDDRTIVDRRQFALERRRFDLDDVRPGVRDRHIELDVGVNGDHALAEHLAVAAHGDFDGADLRALILDAETDRLRLPDDSETRCLREHDAAVDFVLVAGNQRMQRG